MEKSSKKMLKKIQFIAEPKSEDLLRKELEETLGGWNCATFSDGIFTDTCDGGKTDGICQDGANHNYCGNYSCTLKS